MDGPTQRRGNPRHKFSCRALFRDPYAVEAGPWRSCLTKDFSRDGIYFIAGQSLFREGMEVLLRFSNGPRAVHEREYLVEVARLDSLAENWCGVGARLILSAQVGRCEGLLASRPGRPAPESAHEGARLIDVYA
jgi:hypothetical protein